MITSIKTIGKILAIEYDSYREMRLACWRLSDFYEGKEGIKGCEFDIHEYLDMYLGAENAAGETELLTFTWEGYNFPKSALVDFETTFTEHSDREIKLLGSLWRIPDDGYVIVYRASDEITYKHEMCHGLWFTDTEYRVSAKTIITQSIPLELRSYMAERLSLYDYIEGVLEDEINAYLVAYDQEEWAEMFPSAAYDGHWDEMIRVASEKLNQIYQQYTK